MKIEELEAWDEVVAITASDTEQFDSFDALYISATGNVHFKPIYGVPVIMTIAAAHTVLPFKVIKVYDTSTTVAAGNIFGLRQKRFTDHREAGQVYENSETPHIP